MDHYILYTVAGLTGFLIVYLPMAIRRRRERKKQLERFDAMIERYVQEAERGYDLDTLIKKLREP